MHLEARNHHEDVQNSRFWVKECARTLQEFRLWHPEKKRTTSTFLFIKIQPFKIWPVMEAQPPQMIVGSGRNVPVDTLALNVALGTGVAANRLQVGNGCRWFDSVRTSHQWASPWLWPMGWPQSKSEFPLEWSCSNSKDLNTARSYVNYMSMA